MTWIFTVDPVIPGLSITTDGVSKARLQGNPLYPFSGSITVTANNGAVSVSSVVQLTILPLESIPIAVIDSLSIAINRVVFESDIIEISEVPLQVQITSEIL